MVVLKLPISGMTTALSQLMSKRGLVPIQIGADIRIGDVGQHDIIVLLLNNAPMYYRISMKTMLVGAKQNNWPH